MKSGGHPWFLCAQPPCPSCGAAPPLDPVQRDGHGTGPGPGQAEPSRDCVRSARGAASSLWGRRRAAAPLQLWLWLSPSRAGGGARAREQGPPREVRRRGGSALHSRPSLSRAAHSGPPGPPSPPRSAEVGGSRGSAAEFRLPRREHQRTATARGAGARAAAHRSDSQASVVTVCHTTVARCRRGSGAVCGPSPGGPLGSPAQLSLGSPTPGPAAPENERAGARPSSSAGAARRDALPPRCPRHLPPGEGCAGSSLRLLPTLQNLWAFVSDRAEAQPRDRIRVRVPARSVPSGAACL